MSSLSRIIKYVFAEEQTQLYFNIFFKQLSAYHGLRKNKPVFGLMYRKTPFKTTVL